MAFDQMKAMWKMKQMWDRFTRSHPKFPLFMNAARSSGIQVGTIIDISITDPYGKTIATNLKLNADDLALIEELKQMQAQK